MPLKLVKFKRKGAYYSCFVLKSKILAGILKKIAQPCDLTTSAFGSSVIQLHCHSLADLRYDTYLVYDLLCEFGHLFYRLPLALQSYTILHIALCLLSRVTFFYL